MRDSNKNVRERERYLLDGGGPLNYAVFHVESFDVLGHWREVGEEFTKHVHGLTHRQPRAGIIAFLGWAKLCGVHR